MTTACCYCLLFIYGSNEKYSIVYENMYTCIIMIISAFNDNLISNTFIDFAELFNCVMLRVN